MEVDREATIIIGAGMAGLACARTLARSGRPCVVLEASDGIGGRVRTDRLDGFLLDRGFQVILTAYPECRALFDYDALELGTFKPGALVRSEGRLRRLADPWRDPAGAFETLTARVGTLGDKWRVARLRNDVLHGSPHDLLAQPETTTMNELRARGFSEAFISHFFRPFLGGVFLDPMLATSSRLFHFVFRMFAEGDTALPAQGMGELARQLAAGLPPETVWLGRHVVEADARTARLASGERLEGCAVVLAADPVSAVRLAPELGPPPLMRAVRCLYFAAPEPPLEEPILMLAGPDEPGPVNNLCVLSQVNPGYASGGEALISVSVLGGGLPDRALENAVRRQLGNWFGRAAVDRWRHLRTYAINAAVPAQVPPTDPTGQPPRLESGLYVCGDWRATASLDGALASGRRVAEALLADLP